jgi:hypothetical protein
MPADKLCGELARFAQATPVSGLHAVVLRGGWGGDATDVLMTHDCRPSGSEPGRAFCEYLISDTSWEVGTRNAKRAAACLVSNEKSAFIRRVDAYQLPAEITAPVQGGDASVQVTVRIELVNAAATAGKLSVLTFTAAKRGD